MWRHRGRIHAAGVPGFRTGVVGFKRQRESDPTFDQYACHPRTAKLMFVIFNLEGLVEQLGKYMDKTNYSVELHRALTNVKQFFLGDKKPTNGRLRKLMNPVVQRQTAQPRPQEGQAPGVSHDFPQSSASFTWSPEEMLGWVQTQSASDWQESEDWNQDKWHQDSWLKWHKDSFKGRKESEDWKQDDSWPADDSHGESQGHERDWQGDQDSWWHEWHQDSLKGRKESKDWKEDDSWSADDSHGESQGRERDWQGGQDSWWNKWHQDSFDGEPGQLVVS